MKLFRVTVRGMHSSPYGVTYVVSDNPNDAYGQVKHYLDTGGIDGIGYEKDRELEKIELIADTVDFPKCGIMLFVPKAVENGPT